MVLCADISVVMASHVYVVNAQSGTSDERDTYSGKAAKSYNYRFGKDHPFLPSNIETKDGQFIDPKPSRQLNIVGIVIKGPTHNGGNRRTRTQTARRGISRM